MPSLSRAEFVEFVGRARGGGEGATLAVPLAERLLADQLTPVLVYRRLVAEDERLAPSFLFESVEGGERAGRYSIMGHAPLIEFTARASAVSIRDRRHGGRSISQANADPVLALRALSGSMRLAVPPTSRGELPACVLGGWMGFVSYDAVRYAEPAKLPRDRAPADDRGLPDLSFALYDGVTVFDQVARLVHVVRLVMIAPGDDPGAAYDDAVAWLDTTIERIQHAPTPMATGHMPRSIPRSPLSSNTTREGFAAMIARAMEYIRAGDIFQVVLGQRFERRSDADPFDVYRALRVVNPSPYMVYMQSGPAILVSSSPEILCRVRHEPAPGGGTRTITTNRPLAGTRPRGATPEHDLALERDLLADGKERAEHVMLVDLGRNDVGVVARPGTVELSDVMAIERYSHVMHISSTVRGELREGLDCWDALRAMLPVGTISGAPKIRAMQIIDELEACRRGPYGGGIGWIGLDGQMDIALALRTIVVPAAMREARGPGLRDSWVYHLQAGAGIVADSVWEREFDETVHKAGALAHAIDLAEAAFTGRMSLAMHR